MITTQQRFEQANYAGKNIQVELIELWEERSGNLVHCGVKHTDDVVHRGETYTRTDFNITIPNSSSTLQLPSCSLSNVNGIAGKASLKPRARIQCKTILINLNEPDVRLHESYDLMVIGQPSTKRDIVTGTLLPKADPATPVPFRQFSSKDFPGSDF